MYKLCKTERSAMRQRQQELALMEAMLTRHYDEISVSDLCERMQVPRKSFYRYFSGKDGALHGLIDHTLLEFEWNLDVESQNGSKGRVQLERFFRFWEQHRPLLDALERSGMGGVLIERAIRQAVAESSQYAYHSQMDQVQLESTAMFGVCGLMSMVLQWHHEKSHLSVEQMADIAVRIMSAPLLEKE